MAPRRCCRGRSGSGALVLHQKGLNPVVVALLANPIRDGAGLRRHLEPLAEGLGESFQLGLRKVANGGVNLPDRGAIEGQQGRIYLGLLEAISHCRVGVLACGWVAAGTVTVASP
jgi:hypothetical protein